MPIGYMHLDDGAAEGGHEVRMHRAQQLGSQPVQLLTENWVTGAALLGILGLQTGHAEACLVEQPDVLYSRISIHTPASAKIMIAC